MKAQLLLDRFGGESDLPTDLPLALCTAAIDQRQLNAVRLVQTQPVEIAGREILAAAARRPEFLYRTRQIDRHGRSSDNAEPVGSVYTGIVRFWWARPMTAVSSR